MKHKDCARADIRNPAGEPLPAVSAHLSPGQVDFAPTADESSKFPDEVAKTGDTLTPPPRDLRPEPVRNSCWRWGINE